MALYTGKGDTGTTTTFGPDASNRGSDPAGRWSCNQQRISKSSEVPEALGALDELNAFLGLVKMRAADSERIGGIVHEVQETLFIIQAEVADADKRVREDAVKKIEKLVNEIEKEIPPVKGFSIAGGTELSALLDVARTLARRAERRVIAVQEMHLRELSPATMAYLNRLSSLLFALARLANHLAGVAEVVPHY